jgi:hypothetical protein
MKRVIQGDKIRQSAQFHIKCGQSTGQAKAGYAVRRIITGSNGEAHYWEGTYSALSRLTRMLRNSTGSL